MMVSMLQWLKPKLLRLGDGTEQLLLLLLLLSMLLRFMRKLLALRLLGARRQHDAAAAHVHRGPRLARRGCRRQQG